MNLFQVHQVVALLRIQSSFLDFMENTKVLGVALKNMQICLGGEEQSES